MTCAFNRIDNYSNACINEMKQSFEVEKPISDATTTYVVHSAKRAAVAGEHKDFLITKMDHKPAMCNEIVPEICVQKFTPS